jgi:hypothetical protein
MKLMAKLTQQSRYDGWQWWVLMELDTSEKLVGPWNHLTWFGCEAASQFCLPTKGKLFQLFTSTSNHDNTLVVSTVS